MNFSHISPVYILESKSCFNVKPTTYYFHVKTKILVDFQICFSVPLISSYLLPSFSLVVTLEKIVLIKKVYAKLSYKSFKGMI